MRLFLMTAVLGVFSCQAAAQLMCGVRSEVVDQLLNHYGETRAALGIVNDGSVIERLTSENGLTWTLIITRPNGTSCLIAAGTHWEVLRPKNKDPKS